MEKVVNFLPEAYLLIFFQLTCKGWYLSNQFPNSKRHNSAVTTTLMLMLMKFLFSETSSYLHPPVHQEDLFQNHKSKVDRLPKLAQNWWQLFVFDVLGECLFFFEAGWKFSTLISNQGCYNNACVYKLGSQGVGIQNASLTLTTKAQKLGENNLI